MHLKRGQHVMWHRHTIEHKVLWTAPMLCCKWLSTLQEKQEAVTEAIGAHIHSHLQALGVNAVDQRHQVPCAVGQRLGLGRQRGRLRRC